MMGFIGCGEGLDDTTWAVRFSSVEDSGADIIYSENDYHSLIL
jgi:hypothetical protein